MASWTWHRWLFGLLYSISHEIFSVWDQQFSSFVNFPPLMGDKSLFKFNSVTSHQHIYISSAAISVMICISRDFLFHQIKSTPVKIWKWNSHLSIFSQWFSSALELFRVIIDFRRHILSATSLVDCVCPLKNFNRKKLRSNRYSPRSPPSPSSATNNITE